MATTPSDQDTIHMATVFFNATDSEPMASVQLYMRGRVAGELSQVPEFQPTAKMRRLYVNMPIPVDHDDLLFVEWVMRGILDDTQKIHSKYVTNWTFAQEWRDLSTTMKEQQ